MIQQLLAPLHPDENALTPLFQANFDEGMLREIAEADYGWKADECYTMLQPMLAAGAVAADDFNLREVLELIRWSEPDDHEWSPGGYEERGHWMRLFACTALVRFAPAHLDQVEGECSTLAQLVSSAIELGQPVESAAASMLAWRFLACPGRMDDAAPFLAFAILLLATRLESGGDLGLWLKDVAGWVEDGESQARKSVSEWGCSNPNWNEWLLGLTFYKLRNATWRRLAHTILARPERPHPPEAAEALQLLGELVAGI